MQHSANIFDGDVYVPHTDNRRLHAQLQRIFAFAKNGNWRTLEEIQTGTGDPPSSISAQLRHLRKDRFGKHTVEKRPCGDRRNGLWEYRLLVNPRGVCPETGECLVFGKSTRPHLTAINKAEAMIRCLTNEEQQELFSRFGIVDKQITPV